MTLQCSCFPFASFFKKGGEAQKPAAEKPKMLLGSMTLESRKHEYDGVSTWHFKPDQDYPFEAGMMLHMIAPGNPPDGPKNNDTVRHLSFASAPKEGVFSFAMDVSSSTDFKQKMDALQPGGKCEFFKIKFKHFAPAWTAEQREVVFIAGGIGITPIRSLIVQHGDAIDWQLIHVARNSKHLYAAELKNLGEVECTDHAGVASKVAAAVSKKPRALYYICGSDRFMQGMLALLAEHGVPEDRIKQESFK